MRTPHKALLAALLLAGASCSASNTPPAGGSVNVAPPPADTAEPAPPPSAAPTAVATASAAPARPAIPPIDPSAACLFCRAEGSKCVRPDSSSMLGSLTCGAGSQVTRSKINGTPIDCDAGCCPRLPVKGADTDHDGIPDVDDRCPDMPEDADGFQDSDGCPDADNDKDGVEDIHDQCCYVPEDLDGFQDLDGCPD